MTSQSGLNRHAYLTTATTVTSYHRHHRHHHHRHRTEQVVFLPVHKESALLDLSFNSRNCKVPMPLCSNRTMDAVDLDECLLHLVHQRDPPRQPGHFLTVPYITAGASGISAAVYGMNIIKQVFVVKILAKSRHFPFIGNGSCNSHCSDNVKCMYTM